MDGRVVEVAFGEDVVADDAAGFALVGPEADEVEAIVAGLVAAVAAVLDVVPYAQQLAQSLVLDPLVVADLMVRQADLDPPVAAFDL